MDLGRPNLVLVIIFVLFRLISDILKALAMAATL